MWILVIFPRSFLVVCVIYISLAKDLLLSKNFGSHKDIPADKYLRDSQAEKYQSY